MLDKIILFLLTLFILNGCYQAGGVESDSDTTGLIFSNSDSLNNADTSTDHGTGKDTSSVTSSDSYTFMDADADTDIDSATDIDTGPYVIPDTEDTDTGTDTDIYIPFYCKGEGVWYDSATGLCWENVPMDDSAEPGFLQDAITHCESLNGEWGQNWHVPAIKELITLMRGCVNGEIVNSNDDRSTCTVGKVCTNGYKLCLTYPQCNSCEADKGPGQEGLYMHPEMYYSGDWFWSSTTLAVPSNMNPQCWVADFSQSRVAAGVCTAFVKHYIKCVNPGPLLD